MSDASVLDYLREQFARVHARLDLLQGDVTNLKVRMTAMEAGQAELNARLDRIDVRIDRIERRLELVSAP